jgi:hypothetical protein
VRTALLELAGWQDVWALLAHPEGLADAYRRRGQPDTRAQRTTRTTLEGHLSKRRQGLARLIASSAEGLLEKYAFEPRLTRLRPRSAHLATQGQQLTDAAALQTDWQLIMGRVEDVASTVHAGWAAANGMRRRDLIRTLVKRVEVAHDHVNMVFRIDPYPGDPSPEKKSLQACRRSPQSPARHQLPARAGSRVGGAAGGGGPALARRRRARGRLPPAAAGGRRVGAQRSSPGVVDADAPSGPDPRGGAGRRRR